MIEQTPGDLITIAEAPVSWTVRYITPEGFDAMLTLRGGDVKQVMGQAKTALAGMVKAGCTPQANSNGHSNGHAAMGAPLCPTHNKPMKQSQHGGWYCPVKVADDDGSGKPVYCKAKAAKI